MKCFSIYSLAALAALAAAQTTNNLPSCATPCVSQFSSGAQFAGCNQLDVKCICANSSFINDIACCLVKDCDEADQQSALKYAKQICSASGVDVPDSVICNASTSASSPSATSSASETGATAAPTSTAGGSKNGTTSASKTATGAATQPTTNAGAVLGAGNLLGAAAAALVLAL